MQYQDLSIAKERTIKMYMQNTNRSISSTYRTLRGKYYTSFIGDYPLLSAIVTSVKTLGLSPSRFQITYAFNQSSELQQLLKKEKMSLLDQLIYPQYIQTELPVNCPTVTKNIKVNIVQV